MLTIFNWILVACWAIFIIYWIYSAAGAKNAARSYGGIGLLIRLGAVVAIVLVLRTGLLPYLNVSPSGNSAIILGVIGDLCAIIGIALAVWARAHLGGNWGMPMSVKEKPELITSGPYSLLRHPIYSGVLLALLGSILIAGPWWLVVFIAGSTYFIFSATQEEKLMIKEFPEQYPAYKKRTWMLVPFIF